MKQNISLIATLLFGLSGADHIPGHPHAHPHHQPFHHGAVHHAPSQHSHQSIHKDGLAIHTVGHTAHGGHASAHSGVDPIHHAGFHGHHAPHHAVHQAVHHPVHHQVWQYRLWSFQGRDPKIEGFWLKINCSKMKSLNFVNWCIGEVSKSDEI